MPVVILSRATDTRRRYLLIAANVNFSFSLWFFFLFFVFFLFLNYFSFLRALLKEREREREKKSVTVVIHNTHRNAHRHSDLFPSRLCCDDAETSVGRWMNG